jgi:hypothetical protein
LLAEFMLRWKEKTAYSEPGDWVFASFRLKGKQPRVANMLVEDYLRPAAAKAGILSSHRDDRGRLVEDDPHNSSPSRHGLISSTMIPRHHEMKRSRKVRPMRITVEVGSIKSIP